MTKQLDEKLEKLCPQGCLSAHCIAGQPTRRKVGKPGQVQIEQSEIQTAQDVVQFMQDLERSPQTLVEQSTDALKVLQRPPFRIVFTDQPLSTTTELVIIRHNKSLQVKDYNISDQLLHRFGGQHGILVAGAPGQGKSTFVASVLNHFAPTNVIKTVESPRDLVVNPSITQLANESQKNALRDTLLLSRPDIVCIDEIRHQEDYKLFADLRLSGIGCFGVIHATKPVDALARFMQHVDLGSLAHIIDTVVYISGGSIAQVLDIQLKVRIPAGLKGKELTRPVVIVKDHTTDQQIFEMYSFADQLVILNEEQLQEQGTKEGQQDLRCAFAQLLIENKTSTCAQAEIEGSLLHIHVGKDVYEQVQELQQHIQDAVGMNVHLHAVQNKESISYEPIVSENSVGLRISTTNTCTVEIENEYLLCGKPSKKGIISIKAQSPQAERFIEALRAGKRIEVYEHQQT